MRTSGPKERIDAPLIALPMHGEVKMRAEGMRTRDAHLIEWLARSHPVTVVSRPEPFPRLTACRRRHPAFEVEGAHLVSPEPVALAEPLRGRQWWRASAKWLPKISDVGSTIAWNPIAAAHYLRAAPRRALVFDFLDDWLVHPAFAPIRPDIEEAYRVICDLAHAVFCNSEATLERATGMGRSDAQLLLNGCDPGAFSTESTARSSRTVIGYAGKLGSRVDFDLVERAIADLDCEFIVAGPVMDRATERVLRGLRASCPGDVHYRDYPALLQSFDIAWVPHRVGDGEVGGDVIKLYEYRASGLPTFSTPIPGAGRLPGVRVAHGDALIAEMREFLAQAPAQRIERETYSVPEEHTWQHKAGEVLASLTPYAQETAE